MSWDSHGGGSVAAGGGDVTVTATAADVPVAPALS
jgi:hypothetical protein